MRDTEASRPWVYLDNNATTAVDRRVVDAMLPYFGERFANPSSIHGLGVAASDAVGVARGQVQALLGAGSEKEVMFTSGGSESNTTAILSALEMQYGRNEIVTSAVEHPSVLAVCEWLERTGRAVVHRISVDRDGQLDREAYSSVLGAKTALVSVQWANNETGVLLPVEELAVEAHEVGALFHSDAVQAAGKVEVEVQRTSIDMLSISAHKLHGPKGVGALFVRNGVRLEPLLRGGHQERRRRAGTENTPGIVGFGKAALLSRAALQVDMPKIAMLRDSLEQKILQRVPGSLVIGVKGKRLPNTLNVAFEDVEADYLLCLLDRTCIAASSGSACASGAMEPSHVLRAMKVPFAYLRGAVRFSFSRQNSPRDVERVLEVLPEAVAELRAASLPMEAAYV